MFDRIVVEPTKCWGIKTEYLSRAVVPFVNMFNCLAYDWTFKDELKVTWHDYKPDIIIC
jgi:hypothetical protein